MIHDIENPERGLCKVASCINLQRNHGNKNWGKFCDKHHKEPIARAERKAARDLHREKLKAEKAARNIERRRNLKLFEKHPRLCKGCGRQRTIVRLGSRKTTCKPCTAKRMRERTLAKEYKITGSEYESMLLEQNGVCSICGLPNNGLRLAVDHCHTTDRVRGLLCNRCNVGLGCFLDNLDLLAAASSYLINSHLRASG